MKTLRATTPHTQSAAPDEALRRLFAQRTSDVPVAPDVAAVAVGRARRISRRRTSVGGLAAALAFVLTLGTAVSMRGWWITDENSGGGGGSSVAGLGQVEFDAQATEQPIDFSPVALRVDVTVDNRIWDAAAGKWLSTGSTDPLTDVVRVPLGWLAGDRSGVRLVQYDGTVRPVASGQISWTVSADGSQIAMVQNTTLSISEVTGHGAVELHETVVPEGETPIAFVASTVVLTSSTGQIDAWRPGASLDNTSVRYVYTSAQDETFGLVASPGSGRPCLAKVGAAGPGVRQLAMAGCHDLLAQGVGKAVVSPDGQHLATPFDGGMWIINLGRSVAASAANPSAAPVWVATCASDADATPVWQDATTVVTSAHGSVVSCGVDGVQRPVELPKGVPATVRLVQNRRS